MRLSKQILELRDVPRSEAREGKSFLNYFVGVAVDIRGTI